MEKDDFEYGAFVKHKAPEVTEHLESLEEATPLETTEHLQFQEKIRKVKEVEQQRARLEKEKKKARILAVKKAQLEKEQEKTEQLNAVETAATENISETETLKETDSNVNSQSESTAIFDWEVPFMNDGTEPEVSKKKSKKTKKEKEPNIKKNTKNERKLHKEEVLLTKPKFSIGAKLIGIISSIMIISMIGLTLLVSYFISDDTRVKAEENNMTINNRSAADVANRLGTVVSNVGMFLDLLDKNTQATNDIQSYTQTFFERNSDIVAVYLPDSNRIFSNGQFIISNELTSDFVVSYLENEVDDMAQAGSFVIENSSPYFQLPVMTLFYSLGSMAEDSSVAVIYSTEKLAESFSEGSVNQSFLVNSNGTVLVHSDLSAMLSALDMSENPVVLQFLSDNQASEQFYYKDSLQEEYIGAYNRISEGNCCVITNVKTEVVLEAVNKTTRRNIYLTIATLSLAIMIIWFFAKSLSIPLKVLTEVTNQINMGYFEKEIFDGLKIHRKDEIGVLASSTKNEQQILNTFSHLTNQAVTKAVIRKEIDFDAHLKDITIFFSDIRGFTAISDSFTKRFGEKSAGEIINFLNDYMSRMVNCITITGGTVDKFEGDAIMACWGVLRNDSLDFELMDDSNPEKARLMEEHNFHVKQDALNAVRTVIGMRYALMKYNKDADLYTKQQKHEGNEKLKPHIKIGSGMNTGRATVGFMGSYDKMEFTSIGDAVNMASRTEASNKLCGTDSLITETTYSILKMDYIRCEENNFTLKPENEEYEIIVEKIPVSFDVKGKGKQHFYGIVNMPKFDIDKFFKTNDPDFVCDPDCSNCAGPAGPKTLSEVRKLLDLPEPDYSGVDLDKQEDKTKISSN